MASGHRFINAISDLYRLIPSRLAILACLSVISHASAATAYQVHVVDQDGNPVKDAVVAIPDGKVDTVQSKPAVMDQVDVAFVPHVLAVEQGREVIFPNSDNIRHHVYSFSDPKRFEIKLYKGVPKTPIRFDQPGLVALGCNIHDSMLGYIYVSPWPTFTTTNETGISQFEGTPSKVAVWHPWLKDRKEPLILELVAPNAPNTQNSDGNDSPMMVETYRVTLTLTQPRPQKRFKKFKKRYND